MAWPTAQACRAGQEVGEEIVVQRQRCPGASGFTVRRAKIVVEGFTSTAYWRLSAKSPGPVTFTVTVPEPTPFASTRETEPRALLGIERDDLVGLGEAERAVAGDRHLIIAAFAFDIVEVEPDRALVSREQEARQRCGDHHRIAHDHIIRSLPDFVLAPGDGHHPDRAGEGGNVEARLGCAVGTDGDDAGIERERGLRGGLPCSSPPPPSPPTRICPWCPACRRSTGRRGRVPRPTACAGRDNSPPAPAPCSW